MEQKIVEEILKIVKIKEKQAKKRAIIFALISTIMALFLITYASWKVIVSERKVMYVESRLRKIDMEIAEAKSVKFKLIKDSIELTRSNMLNRHLISQYKFLKFKNDSLSNSLTESVITLGKAVSVTAEFKKFIDKEEPYLRSRNEASFYINFRMLEDKISGNYESLSKKISELPKLDYNRNWIVIVESSASLEDIKMEARRLLLIYGKDQVVIYEDPKGNFALSLKGNGTFTRAYRLNVELRDKYGYKGAFFSESDKWGRDYLKK